MAREARQIRWHTLPVDRRRSVLRASAAYRAGASQPAGIAADAEVAALLELGIPISEGADTPVELALDLLKLAAEVEHALMAQYLYNVTSIDDSDDESAVHQRELLNIAIEEMGHLATVQNLLLLVGGPDQLHLQRDLYRRTSEYNPLPFVLEPVTRAALAKSVVAEMPASIPAQLRELVEPLRQLAEKHAGHELRRVGAIYTFLKWMFMPEADARAWIALPLDLPLPTRAHLVDSDLRPPEEVAAFAADPAEWTSTLATFILEAPRTCADAVTAIEMVAAQGEGLEAGEASHFTRFLGLVEAFDKGHLKVRALAESPTLTPGHGAEPGQVIEAPYARAWGTVFSHQYTLLAMTIQHALLTSRDGDDAALRAGLTSLALRGMNRILLPTAAICASTVMKDGETQLAGPPYDLDSGMLVDASAAALRDRQLGILDRLADTYAVIEQSAALTSEHAAQVENLRKFDSRRRTLLTPPPT